MPQALRAVLEQLQGSPQVVLRQLAVGQGDVGEVEVGFQRLR
jgi:hypothetical protein